MAHKVILTNSLYHVLVYGYFEHCDVVFKHEMATDGIILTDSDKVSQMQIFARIRNTIRCGTHLEPGVISLDKTLYPKVFFLSQIEYYWFVKIIRMSFEELKEKSNGEFSLLISNLRTSEAINYLMNKFREENGF